MVGRIAEGIGAALLEFYGATGDWDAETSNQGDITGDFGSAVVGARGACVAIPKHWPVASRTADWLKKSGYKSLTAINCRPDFYVTKAGQNYVVEVKPDATLQSAALALGQLAIYAEKLNCSGKIVVFPKEFRDDPYTRLDRYDGLIEVVYV